MGRRSLAVLVAVQIVAIAAVKYVHGVEGFTYALVGAVVAGTVLGVVLRVLVRRATRVG